MEIVDKRLQRLEEAVNKLEEWKDGHDLNQMSDDIRDLITLFYGSDRDKSSALLPQIKSMIETEKQRNTAIKVAAGLMTLVNIPEAIQLVRLVFFP